MIGKVEVLLMRPLQRGPARRITTLHAFALPRYQRLLEAARKRELDVVLVWRYDRFARSTRALVNALGEFKARGMAFISYQENVDTTTPQGELVFGMMANLAQFESALIGERVKAGMVRAKAQGQRISRPPIPEATRQRIAELHGQGTSIKRIAKELGIAYGTAWNYVTGKTRARSGEAP